MRERDVRCVAAQGPAVIARGARVLGAACAAAAFLLLFSCASAPKRSTTEWMGVLPADATLYLSVAVPSSAELIRKTLRDSGPDFRDVVTLADRTKRLLASVTLSRGEPARFSAVALGDYPAFFIGASLSGKKDWKQVSAPDGSFYAWRKAGLQLAVPANGLLMAANGEMPSLLRRYKVPVPLPIPPEVLGDMERTDVVLYMPQLPGGLGQEDMDQPVAEGGQPRLPIGQVWVDAMKTKTGYEVGATMTTTTEEKARVLALIVRVAIVAWLRSQDVPNAMERLRGISVLPDGTMVRVKGIAITDSEIMPLFFSLLNGPPAPEEQAPQEQAP